MIDHLLAKGLAPDPIVRKGIRHFLKKESQKI